MKKSRLHLLPAKPFLFLLLLAGFANTSQAQSDIVDDLLKESKPKREYVGYTFKTTRVINGHSVETVKKNCLDFRVVHRFGDIAVPGVSGHTLGGIDAATDILLSLEYGILDDLTVGVGRAQGAGSMRELYNGFVKYRALKQTTDFKIPLTITLFGNAVISSQKADPFDISKTLKQQPFAARMSYCLQAYLACKATNWLSVQLTPSFLWRNYVAYNDQNYLFSLGISARAKVSKRTAILFEYFTPLQKPGSTYREYFGLVRGLKNAAFYPSLHLGVEFETGGHVFHINLTNTPGILENDFLAYNNRSWAQGQIRLGFTISRVFQLSRHARQNSWGGGAEGKKKKS
ncbi:MAG: DUF5777 family beta-barrel protein [Chitinophagales bacterium]